MNKDKLIPYLVLIAIVLGVLFLYSLRAEAGTATVTWEAATTDIDGNPIFPTGTDIQVFVRTVVTDGVSVWVPSNVLRRCEANFSLSASNQCVATSGCHS